MPYLKDIDLHQVLFMDIETVPLKMHLEEIPPPLAAQWRTRLEKQEKRQLLPPQPEQYDKRFFDEAGIFAEFARVICISFGRLVEEQGKEVFMLTSYSGDDEAALLKQFANYLTTASSRHGRKRIHYLCAHNGLEFDFPFLSRRMVVHQLPIPTILNYQNLKPWEVPALDTMQLWKFGDYKAYTSLPLLAAVLGFPSPKDDIQGAEVAHVYYVEKDLPRICTYCQKDVFACFQVYRRLNNLPLFPQESLRIIAPNAPKLGA